MCGIAGYFDCTGQTSLENAANAVARMSDLLIHRGPDDGGIWVDEKCGLALGHRRLSVLDLSAAGRQPMMSACKRYVISYNGEIFNYRGLRLELEQQQAVPTGGWRSQSDTEVLLASISHWGLEQTLARVNGMFAFALWDCLSLELHLVRDRMGEKPLYYGISKGHFLFGSELKALRAAPNCRLETDRDAVTLLLRHNYIPAPYSIYDGIYKLPAAGHLRCSLDQLERGVLPVPEVYWSLAGVAESGLRTPFAGTEDDAIDEAAELLADAVRLRLVSDVPLGAFLSGGIDSSLIVALMQAQSARPVKTFSIGFHHEGYNEADHASRVAAHLGTDHTEHYVSPQEALATIPDLVRLYDEPFADPSQIPTLLLAGLARQQVKVSLSGDGGDELFAGYVRYRLAAGFWNMARPFPRAVRGMLSVFALHLGDALACLSPATVPSDYPRRSTPLASRLTRLSECLEADSAPDCYRRLVSLWQQPENIVRLGKEPPTILSDQSMPISSQDFLLQMMFLDQRGYLPDDILVKLDRAAMGVGLETRVPFLDHRLVEFSWKLPAALKVRGREGKWLLRRLLARHVPLELTDRAKAGFSVPLDHWLRKPLRDWAESLLSRDRLEKEGLFCSAPVRKRWEEHLAGKRRWDYHLWPILMYQAWQEKL